MVSITPQTLPDLVGRAIFFNGGHHDPLVPPENTQRHAEFLRAAGAQVTLHWSEGGHQLACLRLKPPGHGWQQFPSLSPVATS